MSRNRDLVESFSDFIGQKIDASVEKNIEFEKLSNYNSIMLIGTVNEILIGEFLNKLFIVNNNVKVYLIGQATMEKLINEFPDNVIKLYVRNGRFSAEDILIVSKVWEIEKMEAVIYFNNYIHSVDYSNVEHAISVIKNKKNIFSYSVVHNELNKILNLGVHYRSLILYKDMVDLYQEIITNE